MLAELRIVNFALIEQLHIQFESGFTVLTGETGAGKSLLIDAIALLVGGRGSAEQIRSEEEEALLEASFQLPSAHPLLGKLRAMDVLGPHDSDLVLKRILSRSGRHRVYVNGGLSSLRVLEELGGTLVDVHGQHEQQSLLAPAKQLEAVDAFGSALPIRKLYEAAYRHWKDLEAELDRLRRLGSNGARLEDLLRFQLNEIEQAAVSTEDEEERLHAERQRLSHAHRLRELAETSYAELQGDEQAILVQLARNGRLLAELGRTDPAMRDCEAQLQEAAIQLKDLAGRLRDYTADLEADPTRLGFVEDRLERIRRLKAKYGGSIEAVIGTAERARLELATMENQASRIAEVTNQLQAAERTVTERATELSKKRREAAKRLTAVVAKELAALKMEHTAFDIVVTAVEIPAELGPTGGDRIEFVLSSNVGEPPRPLSRIASGGELSRIMLALKTVLAERDHVPVLVFDEVDTGVGGAVAAAMGTRLRKLGAFHQVFCITHLQQVASQADHHLLVAKEQDGKRTTTTVSVLTGLGREEEIARMIGGETVTSKVRATAAELIAGAKTKR
ncbi:MAG TPA: DNA repair protein RecN [Nitrospira sp.]|nr:DNA repair protein RecN [Nitrospira sp.]